MKRKYIWSVGLTLVALVVAWGCSDAGMRVVGDAMVEAGTGLRDATADAAAQDDGCSGWEVSSLSGYSTVGEINEVELAGFEPFAVDYDARLWVRRCVP